MEAGHLYQRLITRLLKHIKGLDANKIAGTHLIWGSILDIVLNNA